MVANSNRHFMLCSPFSWQVVSHGPSNVNLSLFQLLCGQAAVIGFVWMAHLKRCSLSQSREPEPKPIPTLGTAPTHLQPLRSRAAKPAGCALTAPPGRWVANVFPGSMICDFHLTTEPLWRVHISSLWFEDTPYGKRQLAFPSVFTHFFTLSRHS